MESNDKNNTEGTDENTSGGNEDEQTVDAIASTSSPKRYKFDNDSPSTSR